MSELNNLKNSHRKSSKVQRVGRGPGSKRGKTSCRGQKGAGSRSGYKRRYGYEGGQMRLFAKLPHRGFSRERFAKPLSIINLGDIEKMYNDGEKVSLETLHAKGYLPKTGNFGLKVLSKGTLSKKVTIEANAYSQEAIKQLDEKKISYTVV